MKGVLLVNLGTPDAPTSDAVGKYLVEFLSDPLVVDLPRWLWLPLLRLVIVPLRKRRSAEAYKAVWTDQGSPLLVGSRALCDRLANRLPDARVALAMRYGEPSIRMTLETLREQGVTDLVLLPMYPQFSNTTTRTVIDATEQALREIGWFPRMTTIEKYHDDPRWIRAISNSIRSFWADHGNAERLLFSLHGIPQRYSEQGDPYQEQCEQSVADIVRELALDGDECLLAYQSRVGREPWLQPYTDKMLETWAADGIKSVQVVCPGFSIDCLETLEEIAMQNRELFENMGGKRLEYIPALNDSDDQVELYAALVEDAFRNF